MIGETSAIARPRGFAVLLKRGCSLPRWRYRNSGGAILPNDFKLPLQLDLAAPLRTDQHFDGFIWRAEHTEVIGSDSGCPDVRASPISASLSVKGVLP